MSAPATRLSRLLLALVLCLQSGLAMAQCLRMAAPTGGAGLHLEICTAEGLVTIALPGDLADGQDGKADTPASRGIFCPVCHGLPQVDLPPPVELPAPRLAAAPVAWLAPAPVPALGGRAPPYRPTGPPALS